MKKWTSKSKTKNKEALPSLLPSSLSLLQAREKKESQGEWARQRIRQLGQ